MARMNFGGVDENVVTREEFPLEKAREVLGKRIFDRLQMMIKPFQNRRTISCTWESYRERANAIPHDLKEILTITSPPLGKSSVSVCTQCGLPENFCEHSKNIPDDQILQFRRDNFKLVPTSLSPAEYKNHILKCQAADKKYQELYADFMKKLYKK